jgi:phage repressor protein C with HTH and peptisase S24 domain
MLTHAQIWAAIDRLAKRADLSASGLAKRAGLDPTTFNKSKRITRQGRERWPSTESVAKSLAATGISIEEFVNLITERTADAGRTLPLMGFAQVSAVSHFDAAGFPTAKGWDAIPFSAPPDEHAYALEIAGDILQPTYRDGTVIVVSPAAPVRRGDRVVVMTRAGELIATELRRAAGKTIDIRALTSEQAERSLPGDEVAWMARIVWASQ